MTPTPNSTVVSVGGHRITLTNLDKVLYPSTGTTKGDVLAYYAEIAPVLIPHVTNRPATRKRWVNGVGTAEAPGTVFFQKNLDESTPSWVKRRSIQHKERTNQYPLVNDEATLIWLGQTATLEIHVPQWQFGRTGQRRNPDRLVLDLDPGEGAGLAECAEVARLVRAILAGMGLTAMPVTSGSKGIHLYAALDGSQSSDQVSAVAHELARALETDHPDLVVSNMKKAIRGGKVLMDWSQNSESKTTIAPYSLRGRLTPTVAAPRTWRELESEGLEQLDYKEVLRRVRRRGDPQAGLVSGHLQSLEPTVARMRTFVPSGEDRLARYRSMRDATKTPEPVPEGPGSASVGRSFVIQEHRARRLHYDFRLEHDGVLVSWALPRGVPDEPAKNHLAVQTEDHPLEYGTFEGIIPAGEYGAGAVTIWDAGSYDLEKWRDGEEVIVTLHGRAGGGLGGDRRFALIHTGGDAGAEQNWLIHLMSPPVPTASPSAAAPPPDPGPVRTGRGAPGGPAATAPAASGPAPPGWVPPMLATLGAAGDIADPEDWAFEMKWDGIRAIGAVDHGRATLTSRNRVDLTATYPELAELTDALAAASAVVDGEIVALDPRGRPDFGLLQTRMNLTGTADIERAARAVPVHLLVFDLLAVDGRSLLRSGYDERRAQLARLFRETPGGRIQLPPAFPGDLSAAIETSRELGLEGIVAKNRASAYRAGQRGAAWIKIKHHRTQEVVVGGWTAGRGRRADGVGALLLGIPDGGVLRYVGRVGTGFTDRQLDEIRATLSALYRDTPSLEGLTGAESRGVHWVEPTLVGEVEFAEWTPTRRLRQSSWRGWRPDKSPGEVRPE